MEIKVCDYCSKHLNSGLDFPISFVFGYGSIFDGEVKEFCCDECALIWYIKEYKRYKRKIQTKPKLKKSLNEIVWNK